MKTNLDILIRGLEKIEISRTKNVVINGVTNDSRKIEKGHLFVAIKGDRFDGHNYVDLAISQGAAVVVVDDGFRQIEHNEIIVIRCSNTRLAYSKICSNWFERPSEKLKVIGVTGTNGKTSVTSMLYNLFKGIGYNVGLISTVEILIDERRIDAHMTTPDAFDLHDYFNQMYDLGCEYVFMEVSSHSLDQHRVADIDFDIGVFTNITHDHLDYHGSFKDYIKAKKMLFDGLSVGSLAVINVDDANGKVMVQNASCNVKSYGLRSVSDYKAKLLSANADGMLISVNDVQFFTRLVGRFNVYNLLAVFAVADRLLELDLFELLERLSAVDTAKGRMELVHMKPYIIVDYAHTPDALENVLSSIKADYKNKIFVVVGCGGDRDKDKRPVMARIASKYGDQVILTSDNPRSEDPMSIINDMFEGVPRGELHKVLAIADRKMAIKTSITFANNEDVILIAGKGHETYQEILGERHYFSDQETVKDILSKDI